MLQLNAIHQEQINLLSAQHKRELNQTRTTQEPVNDDSVNEIIEKALIEFEQEQHDIKPNEIRQTVNISRGLIHNRLQTNQQWYAKEYMPVDALTWPFPQTSSNTRSRLGV